MKTVDLLFFMGQSNMAGRGDAALAPAVTPGMGFEYRAVTAPAQLHPLAEPFGVNENDPAGVNEPGMKTGSMVSSFVNACTAKTGVAIVGVSCAKGGSAIAKWLPGTPYYQDAVRRARKARKFLAENGYTIRHSAMVWCQGCTDGDLHTPKDVYKADTERVLHSFMQDAGAQTCFLIQIGNQRDEPELYLPIQQAQEELTAACDDIIMVSRRFNLCRQGVDERPFPLFAARLQRSGRGSRTQRGRLLESLTKYEKPNRKTVGQFFYFYTVSVILRRYRTSAVSAGRMTSSRSSGAAGAWVAKKARMAE